MRRFPMIVLLVLQSMSSIALAQKQMLAFESAGAARLGDKGKTALNELRQSDRTLAINIAAIDFACLEDEYIDLTLPDGIPLRFKRRNSEPNPANGTISWAGLLEDTCYGAAEFSTDPQNRFVAGCIRIWRGGEHRYIVLRSLEAGVHALVEIDWKKVNVKCATQEG